MCAKITRDPDDLRIKFFEQIELLKLACDNYDQGIELAALNIATSIRVLLHDTSNSTSALTHINSKTIRFLDTSTTNTYPNQTYCGLIYKEFVGVHDGVGGEVNYRPLMKNKFFIKEQWCTFNDWWTKIIFQNPNGSKLTRSVLVLRAANQEGGAHIDHQIDEEYDKFRYHYSGGTSVVGINSGIVRDFDNIPVMPAIRQIGYEVLESIKKATLI